ALAEMIVRGEKALLCRRFKSLVILSSSVSVWASAIFAISNQPFVRLWTAGKFGWSPLNDALLAIWLSVSATSLCHLGLVGQTKQFGFLRYLYAAEGAFFVVLSLIVVPHGGISSMLLVSIIGSLLFSYAYGSWRTSLYLDLPW